MPHDPNFPPPGPLPDPTDADEPARQADLPHPQHHVDHIPLLYGTDPLNTIYAPPILIEDLNAPPAPPADAVPDPEPPSPSLPDPDPTLFGTGGPKPQP